MRQPTQQEADVLSNATACRLATADANGMPHVVPVRFAWDGRFIYVMTGYTTKKLRNLTSNPKAAIQVDGEGRSGLVVQGEAEIVRGGEEFTAGQQILIERGVMRRLRQEGEEALLRIRPLWVASWGLES